MEHRRLYIGIDLGTSRTAVAGSNGLRKIISTAVGYPKDFVSARILNGNKVLFGDDAINNRLSLELCQPLEYGYIKTEGISKQEMSRNIRAVRDIIHHVIGMVRSGNNDPIYCVIGGPAQATAENKHAIIDSVSDYVESVIICSEPFAVAYGMDRLNDALVIDIGAGTVDLCRLKGTFPDPEDQISLYTAGSFVDQTLFNSMKESCKGAQFTIQKVKKLKEKYGTVEDNIDPIIVTLPVQGRPQEFDITDDIKKACLGIVDPIIEALLKLIISFDPDFQDRLRNNIILGGGGSQIRGLDIAITKSLEEVGGGTVTKVEEPLFAGCNGALQIAREMPPEFWEEL